MTVLSFDPTGKGDEFTTASAKFRYAPTSANERENRILLRVKFEEAETYAVLDTGAPTSVVTPAIAALLDLDNTAANALTNLMIRGTRVQGGLHRLNLYLLCDPGEGDDHVCDATVFVPDVRAGEDWNDLPCFIGMLGCIETIRFAIDPIEQVFYFGKAGS